MAFSSRIFSRTGLVCEVSVSCSGDDLWRLVAAGVVGDGRVHVWAWGTTRVWTMRIYSWGSCVCVYYCIRIVAFTYQWYCMDILRCQWSLKDMRGDFEEILIMTSRENTRLLKSEIKCIGVELQSHCVGSTIPWGWKYENWSLSHPMQSTSCCCVWEVVCSAWGTCSLGSNRTSAYFLFRKIS